MGSSSGNEGNGWGDLYHMIPWHLSREQSPLTPHRYPVGGYVI